MSQTFILVSTGQAVANLPPVLEYAGPGDRVAWIESRRARAEGWSAGARAVLARYGLVAGPDIPVDEVNDPAQVVAACRAAAEALGGSRPVVVANGGNKLTPVGLLFGLQALHPVVLYGEEQPAVCWRFEDGFGVPPEIRPYARHTLDLPDILEAGGHAIQNPDAAERFWPGPLPTHLSTRRYGSDPVYSAQLHRDHFARADLNRQTDRLTYPVVQAAAPDLLRLWKAELPAIPFPDRRDLRRDEVFGRVYRSTQDLADGAAARLAARDLPLPAEPLGPALENAVSVRVHRWLTAIRPVAVQAAWRNARVGFAGSPRTTAEFDVLLVLRNGVLLHLECKSAAAGLKDLHARLWNLQRASSRLARMAVCLPCFTAFGGEPWAQSLGELTAQVDGAREPGRMDVVRFTLPGQPHARPGESDCPPFEDALDDLLAPYLLG